MNARIVFQLGQALRYKMPSAICAIAPAVRMFNRQVVPVPVILFMPRRVGGIGPVCIAPWKLGQWNGPLGPSRIVTSGASLSATTGYICMSQSRS